MGSRKFLAIISVLAVVSITTVIFYQNAVSRAEYSKPYSNDSFEKLSVEDPNNINKNIKNIDNITDVKLENSIENLKTAEKDLLKTDKFSENTTGNPTQAKTVKNNDSHSTKTAQVRVILEPEMSKALQTNSIHDTPSDSTDNQNEIKNQVIDDQLNVDKSASETITSTTTIFDNKKSNQTIRNDSNQANHQIFAPAALIIPGKAGNSKTSTTDNYNEHLPDKKVPVSSTDLHSSSSNNQVVEEQNNITDEQLIKTAEIKNTSITDNQKKANYSGDTLLKEHQVLANKKHLGKDIPITKRTQTLPVDLNNQISENITTKSSSSSSIDKSSSSDKNLQVDSNVPSKIIPINTTAKEILTPSNKNSIDELKELQKNKAPEVINPLKTYNHSAETTTTSSIDVSNNPTLVVNSLAHSDLNGKDDFIITSEGGNQIIKNSGIELPPWKHQTITESNAIESNDNLASGVVDGVVGIELFKLSDNPSAEELKDYKAKYDSLKKLYKELNLKIKSEESVLQGYQKWLNQLETTKKKNKGADVERIGTSISDVEKSINRKNEEITQLSSKLKVQKTELKIIKQNLEKYSIKIEPENRLIQQQPWKNK